MTEDHKPAPTSAGLDDGPAPRLDATAERFTADLDRPMVEAEPDLEAAEPVPATDRETPPPSPDADRPAGGLESQELDPQGLDLQEIGSRFDSETFKQGTHWLFHDGEADTLFVSFSTAGRKPGSFNNYKSLASHTCSKLFLCDPGNNYYHQQIEKIAELIHTIAAAKDVKRVVYWGSSMGAYAAVLMSIIGPKIPSAAYAFAPQFNLLHKHTQADIWIKDKGVLDERFTNLMPLIRPNHCERYGFIPCNHWCDGAQVQDWQHLDPRAHKMQAIATSHPVLDELVASLGHDIVDELMLKAQDGSAIDVPEAFAASPQDMTLSVASFEAMEFVAGRGECPPLDVDDEGTRNHGWLNARTRAHHKRKEYLRALDAGVRALQLVPSSLEYQICLANLLQESDLKAGNWLAEGLYRNVARRMPSQRPLLEKHLTRRNLMADMPPAAEPLVSK